MIQENWSLLLWSLLYYKDMNFKCRPASKIFISKCYQSWKCNSCVIDWRGRLIHGYPGCVGCWPGWPEPAAVVPADSHPRNTRQEDVQGNTAARPQNVRSVVLVVKRVYCVVFLWDRNLQEESIWNHNRCGQTLKIKFGQDYVCPGSNHTMVYGILK